jgi:broad specificity phosphatase PhoE
MSVLYIRHGEKEYDNGKGVPLHDPGITDKGKEEIKKVVKKYLIISFPTLIEASPMKRTRETALILQREIHQQTGIFVPIVIKTILSEFLGFRKSKGEILDVHEDTLLYGVMPLEETRKQFEKRCNRVYEMYNKSNDAHIWVITHGLMMYNIANLNDISRKRFKTLEAFLLDHENEQNITLNKK